MKDQKYINRFIQLVRNYQQDKKNSRLPTQGTRQAQFNKLTNVINSTFYPSKPLPTARRLNTNTQSKEEHIKLPSSVKYMCLDAQLQSPNKRKRKYQVYKQFLQKRNSENKDQPSFNKQQLQMNKKVKNHNLSQKKTIHFLQQKEQVQSFQLKKTRKLFSKVNQLVTQSQQSDNKLHVKKVKNMISLDGTSLNFNKLKPIYRTIQRTYKEQMKIDGQKPLYQILKTMSPIRRKERILQAHQVFIGQVIKPNDRLINRQTTKDRWVSPLKLSKPGYKIRRQSENNLKQYILSGWQND